MGLLVDKQSTLERFSSQQSGNDGQKTWNINKLSHNLVDSL